MCIYIDVATLVSINKLIERRHQLICTFDTPTCNMKYMYMYNYMYVCCTYDSAKEKQYIFMSFSF